MAADYTSAEMMAVAAARALSSEDICFVGIGTPSLACNLARLTHAPGITLIYESGTIGTRARRAAALDWRPGAVRNRADHRVGAGDVRNTGSRGGASRSAFSAARSWTASPTSTPA